MSLKSTIKWVVVFDMRQMSWQMQLPAAEVLYQDLLKFPGDATDSFKELSETFVEIRANFAKLGMPVDENRFERFTDLECGHWANLAIKRMRDRGILRGYPDDTFRG